MILRDRLRLGLDLVVLAVFVYAAVEALSFSRRAQYMPLYVSIAGAILTVALLALDYRRMRGLGTARTLRRNLEDYDDPDAPQEDDDTRIGLAAYYLGWMTGYILLVALVGLPVGSALFVASFLLVDARMSLLGTAIGVVTLIGAMLLISHFMHLRWPPSLLGW